MGMLDLIKITCAIPELICGNQLLPVLFSGSFNINRNFD